MSEGERILAAERAYTAGDFRGVRELTSALIGSSDADISTRARALHARVSADPGSGAVLGLCLLLFIGIVVAYAH